MKCVVCSKPLTGMQKKYCSESCALYSKVEIGKKRYRECNPELKKIGCVFCGEIFRPRNASHKCCCRICRNLYEAKKSRQQRKSNSGSKPQKIFFNRSMTFTCPPPPKKEEPKKKPKPKKQKPAIKLNPFSTANSEYSSEIQSYLKNGGEIELFPAQINGRTPDINLTNLSGWSVESMFGFGFEIDLLDKLVEKVMDDADAY